MTASVSDNDQLQLPIPVPPAPPRRSAGLRRWGRLHRADLVWLAPLLAIAGSVHAVGMGRAPQFIDDEGTYTAQAYAVDRLGELTHYTYWYDHPPLGWLQIAGWTRLTGAFDRVDHAVLAGREVMLLATLASVVLLWALTRRLGLPRVVALAAVLIFSLSPLAVQFHRTVYLDNLAVPWILAAFLLASARRHQLIAFSAAALAAAVATLTKETFLLLTPFVAWTMWRSAHPPIRRYTVVVAGSIFAVVGAGYVLFATVKGELMPGSGRVSLWDGIAFQLFERAGSGSLGDADSVLRRSAAVWWELDPVVLVAGSAAALAALASRTLRPLAAAATLMLLLILRPGGYVPVPHVIALLPLLALLIPAVVHQAFKRFQQRRDRRTAVPMVVAGAAALAAVVVAAPIWFSGLRGLVRADFNTPITAAQEWLVDNVPADNRIIVDDAMWTDLVEAGFPRENVVWYYKVDTDPAVIALSPRGWRDSDYVVTTDSMRTFPGAFPQVGTALENSTLVAAFGTGDRQVEIRRVHDDGIATAEATAEAERAARTAAGRQLADNPAVDLDDQTAGAVRSGLLDSRLLMVIADLAGRHDLTLSAPELPGEQGLTRRQVVISQLDGDDVRDGGRAVTAIQGWLAGQPAPFIPVDADLADQGLVVTYPVTPATGLLPGTDTEESQP